MFGLLYIENRPAELRLEWKARPDKRKIIEIQAKALTRAKEMIEEKAAQSDLYEEAKSILQ